MKANQFAKDESAQVGIGTMIVFIATILVAAVAAGVLISVGGDLQSQSKATGQDASSEVANSLSLKRAYARDVPLDAGALQPVDSDSGDDDNVADEIHLYLSLSAGANAIDLTTLKVLLDTGSSVETLLFNDYSGAGTANTAAGWYFTVEKDGAYVAAADAEIAPGELVNIRLVGENTATGYGDRMGIAPGTDLGVSIVLPKGSPLSIDLSMPKVMDEDYEQLY